MMKTTPTTSSAMPAATDSYAASYAKLAAIAEKLRAGEASISVGTLVEDVRAARAAHEVCRLRLDAVRREIDAEVAMAEAVDATADEADPARRA